MLQKTILDADYVCAPLRRMVGIMMRPQRARRATIICSVGSWDPTIVPTPDSTEGNYFRITTRSAAAAVSAAAAAAVSDAAAVAAAALCSSSRPSGGNCLFPPPTARVAPLHGTVWERTEGGREVESGKSGKQPVETWREQKSREFERTAVADIEAPSQHPTLGSQPFAQPAGYLA